MSRQGSRGDRRLMRAAQAPSTAGAPMDSTSQASPARGHHTTRRHRRRRRPAVPRPVRGQWECAPREDVGAHRGPRPPGEDAPARPVPRPHRRLARGAGHRAAPGDPRAPPLPVGAHSPICRRSSSSDSLRSVIDGRPAPRGGPVPARPLRPERDRRHDSTTSRRARGARSREDASTCSWATRRSASTWEEPTSGDPVRGSAGHRQDLHGQGHGGGSGRALPVRVVVGVPVDVLRADGPQDPHYFRELRTMPARGRRHRLHRGDRRHRRCPQGMGPGGHSRRGRGGERAAHPAAVLRQPPGRSARAHCRPRNRWLPPGLHLPSRRPPPTSSSSAPPTGPPTSIRPGAPRPLRPLDPLRPPGQGGARSSTTTWRKRTTRARRPARATRWRR